mmetsp:Transcript_14260/g.44313  ORF Transcript_14260/g.44313 Transcript_14260/m.44313 type:complete len:398 (+) Transcript_14260:300-1493(+)
MPEVARQRRHGLRLGQVALRRRAGTRRGGSRRLRRGARTAVAQGSARAIGPERHLPAEQVPQDVRGLRVVHVALFPRRAGAADDVDRAADGAVGVDGRHGGHVPPAGPRHVRGEALVRREADAVARGEQLAQGEVHRDDGGRRHGEDGGHAVGQQRGRQARDGVPQVVRDGADAHGAQHRHRAGVHDDERGGVARNVQHRGAPLQVKSRGALHLQPRALRHAVEGRRALLVLVGGPCAEGAHGVERPELGAVGRRGALRGRRGSEARRHARGRAAGGAVAPPGDHRVLARRDAAEARVERVGRAAAQRPVVQGPQVEVPIDTARHDRPLQEDGPVDVAGVPEHVDRRRVVGRQRARVPHADGVVGARREQHVAVRGEGDTVDVADVALQVTDDVAAR